MLQLVGMLADNRVRRAHEFLQGRARRIQIRTNQFDTNLLADANEKACGFADDLGSYTTGLDGEGTDQIANTPLRNESLALRRARGTEVCEPRDATAVDILEVVPTILEKHIEHSFGDQDWLCAGVI